MGEIPVRMSGGSVALVDLHDMDRRPRHVGSCQRAQHQPWCVATAYCHNKTAARGHCQSGFFSNDCRSSLGHRVDRIENLDVDGSVSPMTVGSSPGD